MSGLIKYDSTQIDTEHRERNAGEQIAVNASDDQQLIGLWLATKRNALTVDQYSRIIRVFLDFVSVPLRSITLNDMVAYTNSLTHLRPSTQAQRIACVKSLLTFAHKVGYTRINVGATVQAPRGKDTLNERILTEEQVLRVILAATNQRDAALVRMVYRSGGRITEVVTATWADLVEKPKFGQVTLLGKGGKTRTVQLPLDLMALLNAIKGNASPEDRIFPISRQRAWTIVKRLAKQAGITDKLSPHWFRHAHATHALEHGAPLALVSATLGHSGLEITGRYIHNRPDESSGDYLTVG
jgi:integrase/recombinase XerD